ncbi:replication initiation and membrane attachment protein, DnaB2 [Mycoplasma suis str. Illinois]|uniref:Replication initiation and membrane attachment protein, DnaB2 n=1 Tax=Mycoplasma suis (strain Illinois) TaxID=768700 RepID=F0QSC1_MYCSL|nr:replication initiation and membrane attachment protein, DnaB2 [Mycoplasma suis str. Illinois]
MTISSNLSQTEKFLVIELEAREFDWISFFQIYSFSLSRTSLVLFPYLYGQSRINSNNKTETYILLNLLNHLSIDYSEFRKSISELEEYKLISIYSPAKSLKENTLIIKLNSPLPIKELIYNPYFSKNIPENKISELVYGLEKYEEISEISFSQEKKEEKDIDLKSLSSEDQNLYWSFYDELYKNLGREFILSLEIIDIIKDYWKNDKIDSSKLIKLSSLSIKLNEKNEYYLSISELSELIKNELNLLDDSEFRIEEYHLFWKNFLNYKDKKELKKQFKLLFSKHTNIIFYLKLTRRKNIPLAMENWIKECNQKNFNPTMLNGIISFIFSLLKKIPVRYLITMCENLSNDGIHTTEQFLSHIKEVLRYEKNKKNRLGLTIEEINR